MNQVKLNIDDMTAMRITVGHGPEGWIVDAGALGHGSTLVYASPEHIAGIVRGMVDAYLLKAEKVIADGGKGAWVMGKHQCTACKRTFRTAQGLGLHFNHARKNPKVCDGQPRIDPRAAAADAAAAAAWAAAADAAAAAAWAAADAAAAMADVVRAHLTATEVEAALGPRGSP